MIHNVLVLGGTGFVGRAVCERLVQRSGGGGGRIIVPTRRLMHGDRIRMLPTLELVPGSVHDDAFLARQVARADAVINLVAILHGTPAQFQQVHVALPQRLAAACRQAGGKRLVHVSALGVKGDGDAQAAPSHYLRSKAAGEAALRAAGVPLTILRPSVIFGADDSFMNLFATLQAVAPVLPLAGRDARFQPVWVEDVAEAIVRCLDDAGTVGQTLQCTGPQVFTLGELAQRAGQWSGHARPQLALPMALGRLQALLMELLPGQPLMSRDNLDSMQVPNVADPALPGLERLGITPTALDAVAPAYLSQRAGCARLDALRTLARRA